MKDRLENRFFHQEKPFRTFLQCFFPDHSAEFIHENPKFLGIIGVVADQSCQV